MIHFWWSPRTNPSFSGQKAVPGGSWTLVEVFILRAQNVSVILGERIGANRTDTNRNWGGRIPLPSGKQSHNYGKIHHFQWVNHGKSTISWDIHHFQWVNPLFHGISTIFNGYYGIPNHYQSETWLVTGDPQPPDPEASAVGLEAIAWSSLMGHAQDEEAIIKCQFSMVK